MKSIKKIEFKAVIKNALKNYRHVICVGITLLFLCLVPFFFRYAHLRIWESLVDLANSAVFYVSELFELELSGELTVLQYTQVPFTLPMNLPSTWEEFTELWSEFWDLVLTKENFIEYFSSLSDVLYYVSKLLLIIMPFVMVVIIMLQFKQPSAPSDEKKDTKAVFKWKSFERRVYKPVRRWLYDSFLFIRENSYYYKIWAWIWAYNFNFIAIVIEFIAYYLYIISSMDIISLYIQVLKLIIDLSVMINFIPGTIWLIAFVVIMDIIARHVGLNRLRHNESKNRGLLREMAVVNTIYGAMGTGKTKLLTSMAVSCEQDLRDQAYEILFECDYMFPRFPWASLRAEIKKRTLKHELIDNPSVRRWINRTFEDFKYVYDNGLVSWYNRRSRRRGDCPAFLFGYDENVFAVNDSLKMVTLFETVENYALAYFMYHLETSLILSNYSIRVDLELQSVGHFERWANDFFTRNPVYRDRYARFSHILDYDMLRFGARMQKENLKRNAFGFGCYVVTEIDKERKNQLELREVKSSDGDCNQKNDLYNSLLKMSRHACVVKNKVFVRFLCDLQRPEEWGAGGREVGDIIYIERASDMSPVLPWYSPFWLLNIVYRLFKRKFDEMYVDYITFKDNYNLFMFLLKTLFCKFYMYNLRMENLYNSQTQKLVFESGRMDGKTRNKKWYIMPKKDYSERYSTDCLASIFDRPNTVSIKDIEEYAGIIASRDELDRQNSHFQNDIKKYK